MRFQWKLCELDITFTSWLRRINYLRDRNFPQLVKSFLSTQGYTSPNKNLTQVVLTHKSRNYSRHFTTARMASLRHQSARHPHVRPEGFNKRSLNTANPVYIFRTWIGYQRRSRVESPLSGRPTRSSLCVDEVTIYWCRKAFISGINQRLSFHPKLFFSFCLSFGSFSVSEVALLDNTFPAWLFTYTYRS